MISYDPFFKLIEEKGISLYHLEKYDHIPKATLYRMKNKEGISTLTINDLCRVLKCRVEDILVYIEDEEADT